MVHLLRVACTSRGPLADALPQITDELHELGVSLLDNCIFFIHRGKFLHFFPQNYVKPFQILSEEVLDLASKSSPDFNRTFEHAFNQNMVRIPWHTSLLLFTYLSFM